MSGAIKYRKNAYAVIIGINKYQDNRIPNLKFARADAEAIHQILIDPRLGCISPENIILLLDENATQRKIRSAIGTQIPRLTSDNDVVYIYYAGHGYPELDNRTHSHDGMEKYLVPNDAESEDLFSSGISMEEIKRFFSRIAAKQVIFFIDSCYSGCAGGRTFANPNLQTRAPLSGEFLDKLAEGEGRIVITACDVNEVSLEINTIGHGLFTHYLSEGLKGKGDIDRDGLVSIGELYDYVYESVSREARKYGGSMQPVRKGSIRGKIFLTQYETEKQKRARELRKQAVELDSQAKQAYRQGNIAAAYRLWQKVLTIFPEDENARGAILAIDKKWEEEDKKKQQILERRQSVLLNFHKRGKLSIEQFEQGMVLLEKDEKELTQQEKDIQKFLYHLTDSKISITTYLKTIGLLKENILSEKDTPKTDLSVDKKERINKIGNKESHPETGFSQSSYSKEHQEKKTLKETTVFGDLSYNTFSKNGKRWKIVALMVFIFSISIGIYYINKTKDSPVSLYTKAESNYNAQNYSEALVLYTQFTQKYPHDSLIPAVNEKINIINQQTANSKSKKDNDQRMIKELMLKANVAFQKKQYVKPQDDNVIAYTTAVLRIDAAYQPAKDMFNNVITHYETLAEESIQKGKYNEAIIYYQIILKIKPNDADVISKIHLILTQKDELSMDPLEKKTTSGTNEDIISTDKVSENSSFNRSGEIKLTKEDVKIIAGTDSRDLESIITAISQQSASVEYCYQKSAKINPNLRGKIDLEIEIAPDGKVTRANVISSSLGDDQLDDCILRGVKRWRFEIIDVGIVRIGATFSFF